MAGCCRHRRRRSWVDRRRYSRRRVSGPDPSGPGVPDCHRGQFDAALEYRQIMPAVLILRDQGAAGVQRFRLRSSGCRTSQTARPQAIDVPPGTIRLLPPAVHRRQGAVKEGCRHGGIAEYLQAEPACEPYLVDSADICTRATEWRQVGDDGLATSDMSLIAKRDLAPLGKARPLNRLSRQIVERRHPDRVGSRRRSPFSAPANSSRPAGTRPGRRDTLGSCLIAAQLETCATITDLPIRAAIRLPGQRHQAAFCPPAIPEKHHRQRKRSSFAR